MHGSCLSWAFWLSAPPDCIHPLLRCHSQCFTFYCDEHPSRFSDKGKLHASQKRYKLNECAFCCGDVNILKSISEMCVLLWIVVEMSHTNIQMCSRAGGFIFLLKMYTMDVLWKSKVVHFNTTLSAFFPPHVCTM